MTLEYHPRDMGTNDMEQGLAGWVAVARARRGETRTTEWDSDKTKGEETRVIQIIGTADLWGMGNLRPLAQSAGAVRSDQLDSPSADQLEETYRTPFAV